MTIEKMLRYLILANILDTVSLNEVGGSAPYYSLEREYLSLRSEFINYELQNTINKNPLSDTKVNEE